MIVAPTTEVLLSLEPAPDAGRIARHALKETGLDADLDHTVCLLTSELVGNAVRHAGMGNRQRIVFFARLSRDHAHIEVADGGPGFDPGVRHDASGFGLRLVDKLSSDWGVERGEHGCRVWFDIDRRSQVRSGRFDRV